MARDVNLYRVVLKQDIGERWHATLQHDYGWIAKAAGVESAEWYGVVAYLSYDLFDDLGLACDWDGFTTTMAPGLVCRPASRR